MLTTNRTNWIRRWFTNQLNQPQKRHSAGRLSATEILEDRTLLAAITVTTGDDIVDANDGETSLREAITLAQSNGQDDVITIHDDVNFVSLTQGELIIGTPIDIVGNGALINAGDTSRIFSLFSNAVTTLSNLSLAGGNGVSPTTNSGQGGAIRNGGGTLILDGVSVQGNQTFEDGGGIFNTGKLTIMNSSFSGNSANFAGGAVFQNHSDANTRILNSTFGGNSAEDGGAIANDFGKLSIVNSTIVKNTATAEGGGVFAFQDGGTITSLNNTIVAGNTATTGKDDLHITTNGSNDTGTVDVANSWANLIGDAGASAGIADGDRLNIVGNNGTGVRALNTFMEEFENPNGTAGVTFTYALIEGSIAIDAGLTSRAKDPGLDGIFFNGDDGTTFVNDQRGAPFTRVVDAGQPNVDIGAFEYRLPPDLVVTNSSDTDDGNYADLSLREAIKLANNRAGTDTITFGSIQQITLGGTELSITDDVNIIGPGSDKLTISGNALSRIFELTAGIDVELSNLTLTNGNDSTSDGGGAIRSNADNLLLSNLYIHGNTAEIGGGVDLDNSTATTIIKNSTFSNNTATGNSGGIDVTGTVVISNSTFSGNTSAGSGGGVRQDSGTTTIINSTITGNRSESDGETSFPSGGVRVSGTMILHNTIVAGNFTGTGTTPNDIGNGSVDVNSSFNLIGDANTAGGLTDGTNGNIVGNSGTGTRDINTILNTTLQNVDGAMLHLISFSSPAYNNGNNALSVDETSTRLQSDQRGGPFARVMEGTVDIGAHEIIVMQVNTLLDETTDPDTLSLREAIAVANFNPSFDHIYSLPSGTINLTQGQLVIDSNLQITGPGADQLTVDGGLQSQIFHITSGNTVSISGLKLMGGNANVGGGFSVTATGGAINNQGDLTLDQVELTANQSVSDGGAIYSGGSLSIINSTIAENSSNLSGSGVASYGTLSVVNSTVSGNQANNDGGGILNQGTATIINSTITGNRSDSDGNSFGGGGGIRNGIGDALTMHNSIVAGNFNGTGTTPSDILNLGTVTGFNNLIGDAASAGGLIDGTDGNIVGVGGTGVRDIATILDTRLLNNGGPTPTHGLLAGSPALNAGNDARATEDGQIGSTALTGDQRGENRFLGTVDIGAFEGTVFGPDDYGNTFAEAHPLSVPDNIEGELDYLEDEDWFAIPLIQGRSYVFTTTVDANADTIIELYDTDGETFLDGNDDYIGVDVEGDLASRLTFTAATTGTYFLKIISYPFALNVGSYTLTVKPLADDIAGWNASTGRWYFGENINGTIDQKTGPNWSASAGWDIHAGDFNGDGIQDYAGRTDGGAWYVIDGASKTSSYWGQWGSDTAQRWNDPAVQGIVDVGDFNGDGLDDILGKNWKGEFYVSFSQYNSFTLATYMGRVSQAGWVAHRVGDFNGDGMDDVFSFKENGQRWVNESDGSAFTLDYYGAVSDQATAGWRNFLVGDFDGDGIDDVLQQAEFANGQWWKGTSNGQVDGVFITSYVNRWDPNAFQEYKVGDFNGDGKDDLFGRTHSNQLWVNRSLENGRMNAEFWNGWSPGAQFTTVVGDFNGDGLDDIAGVRHSDGGWFLQQAIPKLPANHKFTGSLFGNWTNFTGNNKAFTGTNESFMDVI